VMFRDAQIQVCALEHLRAMKQAAGREQDLQDLSQLDGLVAVGTGVAARPPRRSQRAGLPHWAPALDFGVIASLGPGVQDTYFW
jgi:hypothetical protein